MTQWSLLILMFKITIIADLVALTVFVGYYTRLAPWWRNPIGRTIVILDVLTGLALTPSLVSLFFRFNRVTFWATEWSEGVLFAAIALVVAWRIIVFGRIHKRKDGREDDEQ